MLKLATIMSKVWCRPSACRSWKVPGRTSTSVRIYEVVLCSGRALAQLRDIS